MRDFKVLSVTIYEFQAQAIAEAVSFVNNTYYKRPAVAFSLDNKEYDKPFRDAELAINECTAIVIHYANEMALFQLGAEFGRRSLAIALGADSTSRMQPGLPEQPNKL
jgi:hypothetical protein